MHCSVDPCGYCVTCNFLTMMFVFSAGRGPPVLWRLHHGKLVGNQRGAALAGRERGGSSLPETFRQLQVRCARHSRCATPSALDTVLAQL